MTPWEKFLQEQEEEKERFLNLIQNAHGNADAKKLTLIYIKEGKAACITEFNSIIEKNKLKKFEVVILSEKVRELLMENNIFLKEKQAALKK